jgi:hypothetical protein
MANSKTYVVTCTLANTAYNLLSGTTAAPTMEQRVAASKGHGITFQCQVNGALGYVGGSDLVVAGVITNGIAFLGPDGAYQPPGGSQPGSSAFQAGDWWVASDTAGAVIVGQLIKSI